MEIKASSTYLRISSRKLRLLTVGLRGLPAQIAIQKLLAHPQKGKEFLIKLLKQAVANAENNFKTKGPFTVKTIEVGEGPRFKRQDKSHGARFDRGIIQKRTTHVSLVLESKELAAETETKKVALPKKNVIKKAVKNGSKS